MLKKTIIALCFVVILAACAPAIDNVTASPYAVSISPPPATGEPLPVPSASAAPSAQPSPEMSGQPTNEPSAQPTTDVQGDETQEYIDPERPPHDFSQQPLVDPIYFFIENLFMGAYDEGKYHSRQERGFTYGEFLTQKWFDVYAQEGYIERVNSVLLSTDLGVDTLLSKKDAELLKQFESKNYDSSVYQSLFEFPVQLTDEAYYIAFTRYNGYIHLESEFQDESFDAAIITNAAHNALPRPVSKVDITERDIALTHGELARGGIPGVVPNVTEVYECDLLGDGNVSRIIFSHVSIDELDLMNIVVMPDDLKNGNLGFYTTVIIDNGTDVECIYSEIMPYDTNGTPSEDGAFHLEFWDYYVDHSTMAGIFDIDGDGRFEICVDLRGWEWGTHVLFVADENGEYVEVLRSNSGT